MCMVAQKKQGFGAHTEFRVSQESLHFWNGAFVARRRENGDGLLSDFWSGMTQQSAYRRMRSSLLFHFKKGQRVKNFFRIGSGKIDGQEIGGRPVQHWRAGLLHIQAMLANAFPQGSDILSPDDRNCHEPGAGQQQHDPTDLTRRPAPGSWQFLSSGDNMSLP